MAPAKRHKARRYEVVKVMAAASSALLRVMCSCKWTPEHKCRRSLSVLSHFASKVNSRRQHNKLNSQSISRLMTFHNSKVKSPCPPNNVLLCHENIRCWHHLRCYIYSWRSNYQWNTSMYMEKSDDNLEHHLGVQCRRGHSDLGIMFLGFSERRIKCFSFLKLYTTSTHKLQGTTLY